MLKLSHKEQAKKSPPSHVRVKTRDQIICGDLGRNFLSIPVDIRDQVPAVSPHFRDFKLAKGRVEFEVRGDVAVKR